MTISGFIKDRIIGTVIRVVALAIVIIFLAAFKVAGQAILAVAIVCVLACAAFEMWEYNRRKRFYDRLKKSYDEQKAQMIS